ncbi:MAG: hypothetical protein ACHQQQ_06015 [Bacteroidota bacterium]
MNKKSLILLTVAVVLIIAGFGVRLVTSKTNMIKESHETLGQTKVVSVDAVVADPETYTGIIGVEGLVMKSEGGETAFALGCEDACVLMPVKYKGQPPQEGTNVVVYGEIKKTETSKYIFVAKEIVAK